MTSTLNEELPLTFSQFDLIHGTNHGRAINNYIIVTEVDAPRRPAAEAVRAARDRLVASEPALRCVVDPGLYSQILDNSMRPTDDWCNLLDQPAQSDKEWDLDQATTQLIDKFSRTVDLKTGPTSAIGVVFGPSATRLIFMFHHFVSDYFSINRYVVYFLRELEKPGSQRRQPSPYANYLRQNGVGSMAAEGARNVIAEPLTQIVMNTRSGELSHSEELSSHTFMATVSDPVTSPTLVLALDGALRDVFKLTRTRVDTTVLGRSDALARRAGGWLAHSVPVVNSKNYQTEDLIAQSIRNWPAQFLATRQAVGIGRAENFRAHAFLNFFGEGSLRQRNLFGYKLRGFQRGIPRIKRESETPFHFEISTIGGSVKIVFKAPIDSLEMGVADELLSKFITRSGLILP